MKCPVCEKGTMKKGKIKEEMYGVELGKFPAEICSSCGESLVDANTMKKIESAAKEKGVWSLGNKIKIVRSGNSLAIHIPKQIVEFLKLKEGTEAFIYPKEHKLIVEA